MKRYQQESVLFALAFCAPVAAIVAASILAAVHEHRLHPAAPAAYYCLKQSWEAKADFGLCRDREPESMPL